MATVIDSLLIELGLDTTKFDASQKKSVDQLRKLDDQAQKTSKDIGEGFNFAKDALIAFGTVLSFNSIKNFMADTTKMNFEVGRSASVLSISAKELKTWGQMAELTGGSIAEMTETMKGLQNSLAEVRVGGGADFLKNVGILGAGGAFDLNKSTFDLYKLSDALIAFRDKYGMALTVTQAGKIGIDEKTLLLLLKGKEYLNATHGEFDKLNASMDANAEKAEKLNAAWVQIKNTFESIKQSIYGKVVDYLFSGSSEFEVSDEAWANYDKTRKEYEAKKSSSGSTGGSSFADLEKKYGLPAGMLDKIWQIESNRGKAMESPAGATGHFGFMPKTASAYGLSRADTYDLGKSSEAAARMLSDLLKQYKGNVGMALAAYNWGSGNLAKFGAGNMPLETQDYLAKYSGNYIGARQNVTGAGRSNTQVSTNIQTVQVNTMATDASGIAKDMNKALQDNILINSAIIGAD